MSGRFDAGIGPRDGCVLRSERWRDGDNALSYPGGDGGYMSPDEFRAFGHRIIDWIADYRATLEHRPVIARTAPGEVRSLFPASPPEMPQEFERVLLDLEMMSTDPSYLKSSADGRVKNLRDWGIPLGRRFRALKLWCLLRGGSRWAEVSTSSGHRERPMARRSGPFSLVLAGARPGAAANRLRPS
jgi:hypothetical protein